MKTKYSVCKTCKGAKKIEGMGGIYHTCNKCDGNGIIGSENPTKGEPTTKKEAGIFLDVEQNIYDKKVETRGRKKRVWMTDV